MQSNLRVPCSNTHPIFDSGATRIAGSGVLQGNGEGTEDRHHAESNPRFQGRAVASATACAHRLEGSLAASDERIDITLIASSPLIRRYLNCGRKKRAREMTIHESSS